MNTQKFYRKTQLLIITCLLSVGCSHRHNIDLNPVTSFATSQYCTNENINKTVSIPKNILTVIENKQATINDYINARLTKSGLENAALSTSIEDCQSVFKIGHKIFTSAIFNARSNVIKQSKFKKSKSIIIADVQDKIAYLWSDDQSARHALIRLRNEDKKDFESWATTLATIHAVKVDNHSIEYIKELLQKYDWIDIKRFGNRISSHAWILIQHADAHVDLQTKALKRMEKYLNNGGIKPANYAYLWDRVAVNSDKKQRYGTQPTWECTDEGKLTLQPMENPETVNQRRKEFGLNTVEEGLESMARGVCR